MKGRRQTYMEKIAELRESAGARKKVFHAFCQHVAQGYSADCFEEVSKHHVDEFFEKYPLEFCVEEYKLARQQGKRYWETLGKRQSDGTCLGNSRTWFYNMAMRFGWTDRVEVQNEHKGAVSVNVVHYGSKTPSQPSDKA